MKIESMEPTGKWIIVSRLLAGKTQWALHWQSVDGTLERRGQYEEDWGPVCDAMEQLNALERRLLP